MFASTTKALLRETRYRKNAFFLACASVFLFMLMLQYFIQLAMPSDLDASLSEYRRRMNIHFFRQEAYLPFYETINARIAKGEIRSAYLFAKIDGLEDIVIRIASDAKEQIEDGTFTADPENVPSDYWYNLKRYSLQIGSHTLTCAGLNKPYGSGFPMRLISLRNVRDNQISVVSPDGAKFRHGGYLEELMDELYWTPYHLCLPWNQYAELGLKTVYAVLVYENEIQEENRLDLERSLANIPFEYLATNADAEDDVVAASHNTSYDMVPIASVVFALLLIFQLVFLKSWLEGYRGVARKLRLLGCRKRLLYLVLFLFVVVLYLLTISVSIGIFEYCRQWLMDVGILRPAHASILLPVLIGSMPVVFAYGLLCIRNVLRRKKGELL
ncbi:hypothetical protein FACS1894196_1550 [Clostridia bacterium]|nr:hypothetical protein FACS1894196_1550 [Clostridia bacterium]